MHPPEPASVVSRTSRIRARVKSLLDEVLDEILDGVPPPPLHSADASEEGGPAPESETSSPHDHLLASQKRLQDLAREVLTGVTLYRGTAVTPRLGGRDYVNALEATAEAGAMLARSVLTHTWHVEHDHLLREVSAEWIADSPIFQRQRVQVVFDAKPGVPYDVVVREAGSHIKVSEQQHIVPVSGFRDEPRKLRAGFVPGEDNSPIWVGDGPVPVDPYEAEGSSNEPDVGAKTEGHAKNSDKQEEGA